MNQTMNNKETSQKPLHVVFLHLDLGIGGAEQLIVNLALASLTDTSSSDKNEKSENTKDILNARVSIFTTHCNQSHCFDAVRQHPTKPGRLAKSVHLYGTFIPANIFGYGTAFCSTLRMLYISAAAKWIYPNADVFVLDVLPTSIPFLTMGTKGCIIYYCHFPDKLLTRDTVNGIVMQQHHHLQQVTKFSMKKFFQKSYRKFMDNIEEWSMSYADLICVNSQFTKSELFHAFPSLRNSRKLNNYTDDDVQVLYPAIDLQNFIPPNFDKKSNIIHNMEKQTQQQILQNTNQTLLTSSCPIVSLNRFERKKNIEILLKAYALLLTQIQQRNQQNIEQYHPILIPPLIIAGGFDPRNVENSQYLSELKTLAHELKIENYTSFRPSINDHERAELLQSAFCVVYTPYREHFGIVPLEAMYAGSPVVAMKSGGPCETIIHNSTGILVDVECDDPAHEKLAHALFDLILNPQSIIEMGKNGHKHVMETFGLDNFGQRWYKIVTKNAIPRSKLRLKSKDHYRCFEQVNITSVALLLLTIVIYYIYN